MKSGSKHKPEEDARIKIDKMFDASGWHVATRDAYSPAISAVAIEEGLLKGGLEADYLLFLDGKAIGVLEAKRSGTDLEAVAAAQAENYTRQVPKWVKKWFPDCPLPLVLLSDGEVLLKRLADGTYMRLAKMPTPLAVVDEFKLSSHTAGYPFLSPRGLRNCQIEALTNLEASLREGRRKALVVLATGAGKTFTACAAAYRMLTYGRIKYNRILFLVDRNNLGEQTLGEFGTFRLTETRDPFSAVYQTERIIGHNLDARTNLTISTIQRLYAILTGAEIRSDAEEDEEDPEAEGKSITIGEVTKLPHDYFDAIIIDECHRSIYGRWRAVLDYFDTAKFIGLTATPTPETLEFFDNNCIYEYSLERSIADGVNVDYRVYQIQTETTEYGGEISSGEKVKVVTRINGKMEVVAVDDERAFEANELDRSVVSPAQIRLVLEEFRDAIYNELYVGDLYRERDMAHIPKTLIFAKDESHAQEIVRIAREVFPNQASDFVQSITYSADDPQKMISAFRTSRTFRIAVTVTLIATGTDIKPLEILLFMRDVHSEQLYKQMRGRGVRSIKDDELLSVTPNAKGGKQLFFIIDAVGVTTSEKHLPPPREGGGSDKAPTLAELLELLAHGNLGDDNLRYLASRLSRINSRTDEKQHRRFAEYTHGKSMKELADEIFVALEGNLPPFKGIDADNSCRVTLVAPLIESVDARAYLLELNLGYQTVLMPGEDSIIYTGFSHEEAKIVTDSFAEYIKRNCNTYPALAAIHNYGTTHIFNVDLIELSQGLVSYNHRFTVPYLWNAYQCLEPKNVTRFSNSEERNAITNWIPLCRHAFGDEAPMKSIVGSCDQYYELWKGQVQRGGISEACDAVMREILPYIASSGAYTVATLRAEDFVALIARGNRAFGSQDNFDDALNSLSKFILNR